VQGPTQLRAGGDRRGGCRKKLTDRLVWELRCQRDGFSIDAGIEKGRTTLPAWYLAKPPITENDRFYLTAFTRLTTTRNNGFGIGKIPWDKIVQYAAIKQLDPQMTDVFVEVLCSMDDGYLKWNADNREAERAEAPKTPPPRSARSAR
jgi:hypothetical protein